MNLMPVLTLLGVTTLLPGVPALRCQSGRIEAVHNASELPLQWNTGEETCEVGDGCQDLVMLLENGPQINLLISKGCVKIEDQEPQVTWLRTGPGLSIVSYIRVCRRSDFCNDVSSTKVLGDLPTPTVPGTLSCPLCLSKDGCENAPMQVCPVGSTHCYNGVLRLRGDNIITNLKVQGCMPQPDCNLLNGTKAIGTLDMSEKCGLQLGALTCYKGTMFRLGTGFAKEAVEWSAVSTKVCEPKELCQETLLLIDVGPRTLLLGSKGCSGRGAEDNGSISIYSQPPGMVVASYTRFCSSNLCNEANSSSVLLNSLPRPNVPPPGDLQCPVCVELLASCFQSTNFVTCPQGTTRCYKGDLELQGGGVSSTLSLQGCMSSPTKTLLGGSRTIGIFSTKEIFEDEENDQKPLDGGVSASSLAWVLGLGLFLALCL